MRSSSPWQIAEVELSFELYHIDGKSISAAFKNEFSMKKWVGCVYLEDAWRRSGAVLALTMERCGWCDFFLPVHTHSRQEPPRRYFAQITNNQISAMMRHLLSLHRRQTLLSLRGGPAAAATAPIIISANPPHPSLCHKLRYRSASSFSSSSSSKPNMEQ